MINKNIKLAVFVALVATALWQFTENYIGNGIFLLLLSLLVLLLYFKNEMLISILFKLRKQNFEGAEKTLNKINPEKHLVKNQQGYYYYLKGIIAVQKNDLKTSEGFLKKALDFGLNQKEDEAVANLQLAGITLSKNKQLEAKKFLAAAERLDSKGMLKEQVTMIKNQLQMVKGQKVPMWYNQNKKRAF